MIASEKKILDPGPPLNSTQPMSVFWQALILLEAFLVLWNKLDKFHIDLKNGAFRFLTISPRILPNMIMTRGINLSIIVTEVIKW